MLGFVSERRWLRYAHAHLAAMFPDLPGHSGYNKRLRGLTGTMTWVLHHLAAQTTVRTGEVWVADSTPVECGRSRATTQRSDLAGYAEYGYCASHPRYFWGLRLHLLCTLHGLPVAFALTGAKSDERLVLLDILAATALPDGHHTLIADKNHYGRTFQTELDNSGVTLLRRARNGAAERAGARFFKPLRQISEPVNDTRNPLCQPWESHSDSPVRWREGGEEFP